MSLGAVAQSFGIQPISFTGGNGLDPRGISVGKPVTQQDSVVVNCRTHTNLQYKRTAQMQQYLKLANGMDTGLSSRSNRNDAMDEDSESSEEDDDVPLSREARMRKGMSVLAPGSFDPKNPHLIVYNTPGASDGAYAVAPHELAFHDPEDTQVSLTPGVRQNPVVFTCFNNMVINKRRLPTFMGIVDKPGDLKSHQLMLPNTAVVAIMGTRTAAFYNSEGYCAYAGDLAAWRPRNPNANDRSGRGGGSRKDKLMGTPADKVLPEIIPLNYHETGTGCLYTQVTDFLVNGEDGHRLQEYMVNLAEFIQLLVQKRADVSSGAEYAELMEEKLNQWADNLDVKKGEMNHLVKLVVNKQGGDGMESSESIDKMMAMCIKLIFLTSRSHSLQEAVQKTQTFGTFTANAANGSAAELLIKRCF